MSLRTPVSPPSPRYAGDWRSEPVHHPGGVDSGRRGAAGVPRRLLRSERKVRRLAGSGFCTVLYYKKITDVPFTYTVSDEVDKDSRQSVVPDTQPS